MLFQRKECPSNPRDNNPCDIRFIDCTGTNEEQYACALQFLMGNTDYYVRAFVVDVDGNVFYGNTENVHTQDYDRYDGWADFANVYHAFSNTLFDIVTDEIIIPSEGFYYSTNENPTTVSFQTGTGYNTCYKYATEWNYKLWISQVYNGTVENNESSIVHLPMMKYSDGKLTIEKNSLDADKEITIYYDINGNYFRPETYTEIYTNPITICEPCAVYCCAISSEGYLSYTNMYVVSEVEEKGSYVEVCGIKWAKGNLQYDAVNGGDENFQENWRLAPEQWHFYRYDDDATSYEAQKTDQQVDHFTWGACGNGEFLHDITIYSTAENIDINSKMYLDENCSTQTTDYESAKYGDIAYWATKGQYRMPTVDEINVLINDASYQYGYYLTNDGIKIYGHLFTTPNGNRTTSNSEKQLTEENLSNGLFLPFTGGSNSKKTIIEDKGSYWSSTAETYPQSLAYDTNANPIRGDYNQYYGQWRTDLKSIRPVLFTVKVDGIKGDANNDSQVTMSDVVTIVNYVLGRSNVNFNFFNADVNGNNEVTMADVVGVVNIVLGKTASGARMAENTGMASGTLTLNAETDRMSISLDDTAAYTAFQMDVTLPEGMSINDVAFTGCQTSSHVLSMNTLSDGKVRITGWSARNAELKGNSGELLTLNLSGSQMVGTVVVDNVLFVTANGMEHKLAAAEVFGETTGIHTIENGERRTGDEVYDLSGRKINSQLKKGLYIINNKKAVIYPN